MGVMKVATASEVTNRPASGCRASSYVYRDWMWVFVGVILVCSVAQWPQYRHHVSDNGSVGDDFFDQRGEADQRAHVRQPLSGNEYFFLGGRSSRTCPDMNIDYHRSYMRIPASTDLRSVDPMSQRQYGALLMNFTKPDDHTFYFDSVDGTFRAFPGRLAPSGDVGKFNLRSRPWLRNLKARRAKLKSLGNVTGTRRTSFVRKISDTSCISNCQPTAPALSITLPPLSHNNIVAMACAFGAAVLGGVLLLGVILYCRHQRKVRDQHEAFLRSIESPIPDVPIVEPLRNTVRVAIEMAPIR